MMKVKYLHRSPNCTSDSNIHRVHTDALFYAGKTCTSCVCMMGSCLHSRQKEKAQINNWDAQQAAAQATSLMFRLTAGQRWAEGNRWSNRWGWRNRVSQRRWNGWSRRNGHVANNANLRQIRLQGIPLYGPVEKNKKLANMLKIRCRFSKGPLWSWILQLHMDSKMSS